MRDHEGNRDVGGRLRKGQAGGIGLHDFEFGIRFERSAQEHGRRVDRADLVSERFQISRETPLAAPYVQCEPSDAEQARESFPVKLPVAVVARLARPSNPVARVRFPRGCRCRILVLAHRAYPPSRIMPCSSGRMSEPS